MVVEKACATEFALYFEAQYKFFVINIIIIINLEPLLSLITTPINLLTFFFTETGVFKVCSDIMSKADQDQGPSYSS